MLPKRTLRKAAIAIRPTLEAATAGRDDVEEEEDQVRHEEEIRVRESREGNCEKPQSRKPSTANGSSTKSRKTARVSRFSSQALKSINKEPAKEPTGEYEADRKRELKDGRVTRHTGTILWERTVILQFHLLHSEAWSSVVHKPPQVLTMISSGESAEGSCSSPSFSHASKQMNPCQCPN